MEYPDFAAEGSGRRGIIPSPVDSSEGRSGGRLKPLGVRAKIKPMKNAPVSQPPKQPKVVFVSGRALDAIKFQERIASLQRLRTLPVAQRLGAAAIPFQSKPVLVDRSHWDESL